MCPQTYILDCHFPNGWKIIVLNIFSNVTRKTENFCNYGYLVWVYLRLEHCHHTVSIDHLCRYICAKKLTFPTPGFCILPDILRRQGGAGGGLIRTIWWKRVGKGGGSGSGGWCFRLDFLATFCAALLKRKASFENNCLIVLITNTKCWSKREFLLVEVGWFI